MIPLAIDENFNNDVVRGLLRRNPGLDVVRVQEANMSGASDEAVLDWAARSGRVFVTHDAAHGHQTRLRTCCGGAPNAWGV